MSADQPHHFIHECHTQYEAELEDGVINALVDTNIQEIKCDSLPGSSGPQQVTVVLQDVQAALQEWAVGDVLVASPEWGCSFRGDQRKQPVYLKISSISHSTSVPSALDLTITRGTLTHVFKNLDLDMHSNAVVDPSAPATGAAVAGAASTPVEQQEEQRRRSSRLVSRGTTLDNGVFLTLSHPELSTKQMQC